MEKFRIPVTPSSRSRTIRFPNDLINEVNNVIKGKNTTFNAFVVAATRNALRELKEEKE